jgi:hypothetical protein
VSHNYIETLAVDESEKMTLTISQDPVKLPSSFYYSGDFETDKTYACNESTAGMNNVINVYGALPDKSSPCEANLNTTVPITHTYINKCPYCGNVGSLEIKSGTTQLHCNTVGCDAIYSGYSGGKISGSYTKEIPDCRLFRLTPTSLTEVHCVVTENKNSKTNRLGGLFPTYNYPESGDTTIYSERGDYGDKPNEKIPDTVVNWTLSLETAENILDYMNNNMRYKFYNGRRYSSSQTLTNKAGNCIDLTILTITALTTIGITCKPVRTTCNGVGHVNTILMKNGAEYTWDLACKTLNTYTP